MGRAISDERYPTPPPRILARLVELPFVAVAWTVERLLGVRAVRASGGRRASRRRASAS